MSNPDTHNLDPRHRVVTTLAADLPATSAGAPAHEKGSAIIQVASVQGEDGKVRSVPAFSAPALCLDVAITASIAALDHQAQLSFQEGPTPCGLSESLDGAAAPAYFDMMQSSMTSIIFSYLAIEVYCNDVISRYPNEPITIQKPGRFGDQKTLTLPAKKLEKESTETKITIILPMILKVSNPKGLVVFRDFRALQKLRNDVIHMKGDVVNPRLNPKKGFDSKSIVSKIVGGLDFLDQPTQAIAVIAHFATADGAFDWLDYPKQKLDEARKARS